MQSLMLLSWLGAAAVAAEPVVIEVPTHALATATVDKAQRPSSDLAQRAAHAMHARVDADGRVHYDCTDAVSTHALRGARAAHEEK